MHDAYDRSYGRRNYNRVCVCVSVREKSQKIDTLQKRSVHWMHCIALGSTYTHAHTHEICNAIKHGGLCDIKSN